MENKIADEVYEWAIKMAGSGMDWHHKSLLFMAVKYVEFAESEYMFSGGKKPFWQEPTADSDLMSMVFGEVWNRLVKNGYAGGVKC